MLNIFLEVLKYFLVFCHGHNLEEFCYYFHNFCNTLVLLKTKNFFLRLETDLRHDRYYFPAQFF